MIAITAIAMALVAILSAWHFVYQAILLPSLKFRFTLRLVELRDELRCEYITSLGTIDKEAFARLDEYVSRLVDGLPRITLVAFVRETRLVDLRDLLMKARIKIAEDKEDEDILLAIEAECVLIQLLVVLANSGGWVPYFLVLVWPLVLIRRIRKLCGAILHSPTNARGIMTLLNPNSLVRH